MTISKEKREVMQVGEKRRRISIARWQQEVQTRYNRFAEPVRTAHLRVERALALRDALNQEHGRFKGGVAR